MTQHAVNHVADEHAWKTTTTFDDAVELCTSALYPQQDIALLDDPKRFSLTQRIGHIGPVTLGEITFGSPVWMNCGDQRTTYHLNVPLSGHLDSVHRGEHVTAHSGLAAVYQPQGETAVPRWEAGGRTVFLKIDSSAVDEALRQTLGRETTSSIDFQPALATVTGPGRNWKDMLLLFHSQLFDPESLLNRPMIGAPLVDSLIRGLLLAADHPHRAALLSEARELPSRVIRDAIDIIEAEADTPLTVSSLASRSNISVRSLQEGFRRHVGMSPMAYLREVRLREAHETLLQSDSSTATVASIAHNWGFNNLGRFAAAYSARYQEAPAATLRHRNRF
jgi:AraC-like DNA-binding protein